MTAAQLSFPTRPFADFLSADEHTLVLCGTLRAARRLQQRYAEHQAGQGQLAWQAPRILTPAAFVDQQYEAARRRALLGGDAPPPAINSQQSLALWERAVAPDADRFPLISPLELARLAARTAQAQAEWDLPDGSAHDNPDWPGYARWRARYRKLLTALPAADAPQRLHWWFAQAPEQVGVSGIYLYLHACEHLPRRWQQLFSRFTDQGAGTSTLASGTLADGRTPGRCYPDFDSEAHAAFGWVQAQLGAGRRRIGLVVVDLDQRRREIERLADAWLNPASVAPGGSEVARQYNLSGGWPLQRHAMINSALLLLRLATQPLPISELGSLLRSPYWLDQRQAHLAGQLDIKLREANRQELTLQQLATAASRMAPMSVLAARCHALGQQAPAAAVLPTHEWAQQFGDYLLASGWPGTRTLSSREYQALDDWQQLLLEFAQLAQYLPPLRANDAVDRLARLAQASLFQPRSPETAVQILDWKEARGQDFDALWIMGLDDSRMPPRESCDPLLSYAAQQAAGHPGANPGLQRRQARAQLQALMIGADTVASCALNEAGAELRPAPLSFALVDWQPATAEAPGNPLQLQMAVHTQLQQISDELGPVLEAQAAVSGGTALLSDQAICPFRGFSRHRLQVAALPESETGLSARVRGSLLHRALEDLWHSLQNQQTLLEQSEAQLAQLVDHQIAAAIARFRPQAPELGARGWQIEHARCAQLIHQLLDADRLRAAFSVRRQETETELQLGELALRLRPDRVDQTADGELVIDYKTGRNLNPPWGSERPQDPQLLAYALAEPQVRALAFGQLSASNTGYLGIAEASALAPGITAIGETRSLREGPQTWPELQQHWRTQLTQLAQEYCSGYAPVQPLNSQSCRYCDLQGLCRIDEQPLTEAAR